MWKSGLRVSACMYVCASVFVRFESAHAPHLEGRGGEKHVSGLGDVGSMNVVMVGHIPMIMVF